MPVTAILGEQRGDEGKGRIVDMLMAEHEIGVRFNGGPNAGHTIVTPDGIEYDVHGLPSSIFHEHATSVIANGTVINAPSLSQEIEGFREQGIVIDEGNLLISGIAHLILPHHEVIDATYERGAGAQGSTLKGIAPSYGDKYLRIGLQAGMLKHDRSLVEEVAYERLRKARGPITRTLRLHAEKDQRTAKDYVQLGRRLIPFITDTQHYLDEALAGDKQILAEGAQGFLLDIDHGMYQYVTSSNTTIGGVLNGMGINHNDIGRVVGVVKAIQSHVGKGPFVTEEKDPGVLANLHGDRTAIDAEVGTTTKRTRRLGYLDLPQIRKAQRHNGTREIALTKFDWLSTERFGATVPICVSYERKGKNLKKAPDTGYKYEESIPLYEYFPALKEDIQHIRRFEDLPQEGQDMINFIELETGLPITMIGVGPGRDQVIVREKAV